MKKIKILSVLAILLASMFNVLNVGYINAAGSIAVSPMNQTIVLVPGETYRGGFTVTNPRDAKVDLNYLVTVSPYFPTKSSDDDLSYSGADLTTKTNMNMIVDWLTIDNATGVIEPGEEVRVTFSVKVPNDAPAGGQYAALVARENPESKQKSEGSSISETMQIAHILYAEVAGETDRSAEILENNVPAFLLNNELEATSRVRNDGNIHTNAEYTLQVWPLFSNEEICTNEEDAATGFVMPKTEKYHVESCTLPAVGIFKVRHVVKIFNELSEIERMIVVCPLWLIFTIIAIVIALVIWLIIRTKSRKK